MLQASARVFAAPSPQLKTAITDVQHAELQVGDVSVFYREAGRKGALSFCFCMALRTRPTTFATSCRCSRHTST